jgi:hypothetical protein
VGDVVDAEFTRGFDEQSSLRTLARRTVGVIILVVCCIVFFFAGVLSTASAVTGSGRSVADNVLAIVTSPDVRAAVATKLINQLESDTTASTRDAIVADHTKLIIAVESVISEPRTQQLVRQDLIELYNAASSQSTYYLDLRPLLFRFTMAMHAIDPQIPAKPTGLHHADVAIKNRKSPLYLAHSLFIAEVVFIVIGTLALTLTTRLLIRSRRLRYWALGLTFGLPGLLLIALGLAAKSAAGILQMHDTSTRAIAREAGRHLSTNIIESGTVLLLLALLSVALWALVQGWRHFRSKSQAVAT